MVVVGAGGTSTYSTTAPAEELHHMMTTLGVDPSEMTLFDDRYVVKDAVDVLKTFGKIVETFGPSKELLIDPSVAQRMHALRANGVQDLIVAMCPVAPTPVLLMLFPNNLLIERSPLSTFANGVYCDMTFVCAADDAPTPHEGRIIGLLDAMIRPSFELRVAPGTAAAAYYESFE
jgi:hypothetical protein